ncbi:MAG: serine/threonine-protein kinase [Myxococcota bacterium]|nr:serine/threonine-protein kinase [Myxococcota bacterium]
MGRYRLLEELGSGGFATVYRAEIVGTQGYTPKVAIKRIHPFLTHNSPNVVSSLKNEARLAAMIEHPNVVHVYELGSEPDAEGQLQYYMVMELVEGRTLDILRRMSNKRGEPLPPAVVIDLLLQIARGLAYVHSLTNDDGIALQMVHRDLKPGNVLVSTEGVAKIFDFGIAKAINSQGPRTATGVTRGTAAYMSPEQAYGKKVTFASDLFAFGAILFELAAGDQLIQADSMASQLMTVVNTPADYRADDVEASVPGLGEVFVKLRQPAARDRYDSTDELIETLRVLRRRLEDETDPATFLANLLDDPDVQVSHEEIAHQRVLGPGMRAPSTATFFELPGYRKDSTGKLVPTDQAASSWGVAQASTATAETTVEEAATDMVASSLPGRRWLLAPLLAIPLVVLLLVGLAFAAGRLLRGDGPAGGDAADGGAGEIAAAPAPDPDDGAAAAAAAAEAEADRIRQEEEAAAEQARKEREERKERERREREEAAAESPSEAETEAEVEEERDDGEASAAGKTGTFKINAYPAATVYVDGIKKGSTFVTASRGIELKPGKHRIKMVRSSDGKEQFLTVKIVAGETAVVPFAWEP